MRRPVPDNSDSGKRHFRCAKYAPSSLRTDWQGRRTSQASEGEFLWFVERISLLYGNQTYHSLFYVCLLSLDADRAGTTTSDFNKRYENGEALCLDLINQSKPEVTMLLTCFEGGVPFLKDALVRKYLQARAWRDGKHLNRSHSSSSVRTCSTNFFSIYWT